MQACSSAAARWQKPNPDNPSELLGAAILSNGGFRHNRNWVFWTFLIEVGYLLILIGCTAVCLKILDREAQLPAVHLLHQGSAEPPLCPRLHTCKGERLLVTLRNAPVSRLRQRRLLLTAVSLLMLQLKSVDMLDVVQRFLEPRP